MFADTRGGATTNVSFLTDAATAAGSAASQFGQGVMGAASGAANQFTSGAVGSPMPSSPFAGQTGAFQAGGGLTSLISSILMRRAPGATMAGNIGGSLVQGQNPMNASMSAFNRFVMPSGSSGPVNAGGPGIAGGTPTHTGILGNLLAGI